MGKFFEEVFGEKVVEEVFGGGSQTTFVGAIHASLFVAPTQPTL